MAGAALTTPSQKPGASFRQTGAQARPGSRGGSFSMTGAATKNQTYQVGAAKATQAPSAPTHPTPSIGLLSAGDQLNLAKWNASFQDQMLQIQNAIAQRGAQLQQATGQANLNTARGKDMTSQVDAARGMFNSSLQSNNMADLDAALAFRINTLNTNYNTWMSNTQAKIGQLDATNTAAQNYYTALETQAAQSQDTTPPPSNGAPNAANLPAAQATAGAQASQHPVSTGTTSTGQPTPTGPPQNQQPSSKPNLPKVPSPNAGRGKSQTGGSMNFGTGARMTFGMGV